MILNKNNISLMQLMSIWNTWIMILNINVCVCVLVFSTGIPEWSCWRKIYFMLTFMFLWICTDVSEQKEMGPGLYVCDLELFGL